MPTEKEVIEKLKEVMDPHTGMDVYSMGLISDLELDDESVSLTFTPTSPFCPMGVQLAVQIKKSLAELEGMESKDVNVTIQGHLQADEINKHLAQS